MNEYMFGIVAVIENVTGYTDKFTYLGFKLTWTKFGQITLPFSVVSLDLKLSLKISEHEV
jgi:hypothetical protein